MIDPVDYHCLEPNELDRFLLRRRAHPQTPSDPDLTENLVEILRKANEFVPSAAGSVLLDNPTIKNFQRQKNDLFFIAAFGHNSERLLGRAISGHHGIAGHVYVSGRSYYSADVTDDRHFYSEVDKITAYATESLVAIPIRIEREVCGVLELINRQSPNGYGPRDLDLLEIFASYISVSIQNVLDARQSQEIAQLDNLTGLFNDRYLHIGLNQIIERCRAQGADVAALFMDLDHFKSVNDTYGHLAGSQVLREVGHEISRLVQQPDALAARYGGDEFVLIMPGMNTETAIELGQELRRRIAGRTFLDKPGDIHPEPLFLRHLTCSIGVATLLQHIPSDVDGAEARSLLLRRADEAMYMAKDGGRDRLHVAPRASPSPRQVPGRTFAD
jgi:diguanylate cyclase (GGDEF)-like protein